MITKFEVNKYLGLPGWVALFLWLREKELTGAEIVRIAYTAHGSVMVCPIKVPLHLGADDLMWTVPMQQVKAHAFDEVFNRLPTIEAVLLVQEMVAETSHISHCEHILTFLNNLPTRTECK